MAKRKQKRIIEAVAEAQNIILWREAEITPVGDAAEFTGREWQVTIIGGNIVTVEGENFVRSANDRLYSTKALEASTPQWEGIKVYDNHLTDEEFEKKQGMRSVEGEWLGTIVKPFWDVTSQSVKAFFKVVEDKLATKLKNAFEAGVLNTIGLSIDTFPIINREIQLEGNRFPVIEGFKKILSVDLVAEPAAGGSLDRIVASKVVKENKMEIDDIKQLINDAVSASVPDIVKATLAEAATAAEAAAAEKPEEDQPQKVEEDATPDVVEDDVLVQAATVAAEAVKEAKLARCELLLERKLKAANLADAFRKPIEDTFTGKVFAEAELDKMIASIREAAISTDTTGRAAEGTGRDKLSVTIDEADKLALMLMGKLMGEHQLHGLEKISLGSDENNRMVQTRVGESAAYKSWLNGGKPNINFGGRTSELIRTGYLNGGWYLDDVSFREASTLATVIKNTVNIMTAVDFAGSNRWYDPIVDIIESDNPIDDLTVARLFGADSLDVVAKGAAYTEMTLQDEEETAAHVKQGNFVAVPIEDLLADKIDYFRSLPARLSDAWYNTLSDKVAAVFTTNTAAGPVLSDTGALFNSTAVTTAGGHANLLTTALAWSAFDTVITAMYNQTARTLGTGRKLVDMGPFTILVPNALRATANKIRNSELQPEADGAGTVGNQSANEYGPGGDQPNVVVVPDWTDADNWAVMARYRGASPIKLAFPRGMMTPTIFTADSELAGTMFTNDTIRYKLRMMTYRFSATYDVAPVADWRLLHKSNV